MVLYHWTRCSTCRRVRTELAERGVPVQERDFFAEPLLGDELDALAAHAGGLLALVSTASPSFRTRGRALGDWTDAELRRAILAEPRLLRRPLLVTDDERVLVGARPIVEVARA